MGRPSRPVVLARALLTVERLASVPLIECDLENARSTMHNPMMDGCSHLMLEDGFYSILLALRFLVAPFVCAVGDLHCGRCVLLGFGHAGVGRTRDKADNNATKWGAVKAGEVEYLIVGLHLAICIYNAIVCCHTASHPAALFLLVCH